jgi:hypothetical protein
VDSRVVIWIGEFLLGRTQRARVGGQLSEEVRATSGVLQGSVLDPLLFLAYIRDVWRIIESIIRLFADDRIIWYRNVKNNSDKEKDGLCDLVVRVSGCYPRGPGFDSRRYQIF